MNLGRKYAGAASAIIGSIGFLLGGIVSPIVSLGNIQVTSFAVCVVALGLGVLLLQFSPLKPTALRLIALISPDGTNALGR